MEVRHSENASELWMKASRQANKQQEKNSISSSSNNIVASNGNLFIFHKQCVKHGTWNKIHHFHDCCCCIVSEIEFDDQQVVLPQLLSLAFEPHRTWKRVKTKWKKEPTITTKTTTTTTTSTYQYIIRLTHPDVRTIFLVIWYIGHW